MPRELEVYHGLLRGAPSVEELVKFFKGERGWRLISTSTELGKKVYWGRIGVKLRVPEENVLHISGADAGTPTEPLNSERGKLLVIRWLLLYGGTEAPGMGSGEQYNEVIIQPRSNNEIIGVFYRDKMYRRKAEWLARELGRILKKEIPIEYIPTQKMSDEEAKFLSTPIDSMLIMLSVSRSPKAPIILHHPQEYYSIGIGGGVESKRRPITFFLKRLRLKEENLDELKKLADLLKRFHNILSEYNEAGNILRLQFHGNNIMEYARGAVKVWNFVEGLLAKEGRIHPEEHPGARRAEWEHGHRLALVSRLTEPIRILGAGSIGIRSSKNVNYQVSQEFLRKIFQRKKEHDSPKNLAKDILRRLLENKRNRKRERKVRP